MALAEGSSGWAVDVDAYVARVGANVPTDRLGLLLAQSVDTPAGLLLPLITHQWPLVSRAWQQRADAVKQWQSLCCPAVRQERIQAYTGVVRILGTGLHRAHHVA